MPSDVWMKQLKLIHKTQRHGNIEQMPSISPIRAKRLWRATIAFWKLIPKMKELTTIRALYLKK